MKLVTRQVRTLEVNDAATGAKAKELRKSAKVSLRAVAAQMKYSAPYISDLERGNRGWNLGLVHAYDNAIQAILTKRKIATIRNNKISPEALKQRIGS